MSVVSFTLLYISRLWPTRVHRFSGNSYKGYPTRVEAEGRYARYLAGEMRDMRRNRMKTMAFVMMVMTMFGMFYVILV